MKRFAAHYLLLPDVGFIRQQVVEIADEGYVRDVFPLTEEIESVEWMPGLIALLPVNEIKNTEIVLPEYFFMQFLSNEMDRYGWFISDSSIRSNLDIDRFEEISFELPDISVQRKYVDIYKAIRRVQKLNVKIKDLCPILVRSAVREGRDI